MKITVKKVRRWMKRLPENKWRKVYNVDARRVAYFAKNGTNSTLPKSLQRRRESIGYSKERKMAMKYRRHLREKKAKEKKKKKTTLTTEQKVRNEIRKLVIKEIKKDLNEKTVTRVAAWELGDFPFKEWFNKNSDAVLYIVDIDYADENEDKYRIDRISKDDAELIQTGFKTEKGALKTARRLAARDRNGYYTG